MRVRVIVPLVAAALLIPAAPATADPVSVSAVSALESQAVRIAALTAQIDSLMNTRPRDRVDDAQRTSRQYQRGGAPVFGDSGHPVWKTVPSWIRTFGRCVRHHESVTAGHYKAENPISSASGAYQFLDSTWRGVARWATWKGTRPGAKYSRASSAPAWVQDVVFAKTVLRGGASPWRGTHCGYGT